MFSVNKLVSSLNYKTNVTAFAKKDTFVERNVYYITA